MDDTYPRAARTFHVLRIEHSLESARDDHRYAKEGWRVQILDAEIKRLERELERVGRQR